MAKIESRYMYNHERDEWLGVVYKTEPGLRGTRKTVVLTIGIESSKAEIVAWLESAIQARAWETRAAGPADIYDRTRKES